MTIRLHDILKTDESNENSVFSNSVIEKVDYYREKNYVIVTLKTDSVLSFKEYLLIRKQFSQVLNTKVRLFIHTDDETFDEIEFQKYLNETIKKRPRLNVFHNGLVQYENGVVTFLFGNEAEVNDAEDKLVLLKDELQKYGYTHIELQCKNHITEMVEIEEVNIPIPPKKDVQPEGNKERTNRYHNSYEDVKLVDVSGPMRNVIISGEVCSVDNRENKNKNSVIQILTIFDGTDAISAKRFSNKNVSAEEIMKLKAGIHAHFYGSIAMDNYSNELTLTVNKLEEYEPEVIVDNAKEKRVELHMHTKMSEMDGICSGEEVVNYAYNLGHEGIVITDHSDVQSFVKAYNVAKKLAKKDPEHPFKLGLGCEMNVAEDQLSIVYNPSDEDLNDAEYVCFDLETTGLSCYYDHIIEFGAVKLKNNVVIDRKQMFIKPPVSIPANIIQKTNITNEMVKDAKVFAEVADELVEFIGDSVLVAHNASFDYYFFNEELKRCGKEPIFNTVIDTLDLSRAILPDRHVFRLGNIARNYRITYDEEVAHRADYDAETLSSVFLCLMKDAKTKGALTIQDLQTKVQDFNAFKKVRRSHTTVLVKNHEGLKTLYKLVSKSNTDTLVVTGKSSKSESGEVPAEPRVLRSDLEKHRENLLLGTSCQNNEIWELACNSNEERLEKAMAWYDYVELQPPACYTTYVALGNVPNMERIKEVQKRIIACAKKLGKPVCATSDAHYCKKEEKIFRDVYIMNQGVGGVYHPLYIRNEILRHRTKNPDQHLYLTDEMKQQFSYLEDEDLIHEIVIENPKKIFESLEEVAPVPSGVFAPIIEGSDDKLREICNNRAKELYEFNGEIPKIVSDRLNQELDNIIKNGYGVHYYIAHLLVKRSNDDGYVVGSRGSVGSSFTATMAGITEVNPLQPHYLCPNCHYSEWIEDAEIKSGFDLPDKECPHCHGTMKGDGQSIPFQTFLGFDADKVPDIDLNFSNEYQAKAHAFIKEVFGETHAYRAGTIGGVAEKTAYGYVSGYCEQMGITNMSRAMREYLANGCRDVKRTTGQHPGGIIIIPEGYEAEDFTPVQYPANNPNSEWKTTHYDFHDIHDNVLKFDILGHVDPTAMRLLTNISKTNPLSIPMNDPDALSLFYSDRALNADPRIYHKETGALGLPEFGTKITRRILEETRPKKFSDFVIISGLSHGTDVWAGNAQVLVHNGLGISDVIGCRDDIMTYLLGKQLEPLDAFTIMESVRKGKGLTEKQETVMKEHNVPGWYIDSCKKIKYMFPKAHAVAYVQMAIRIAWYKVHEPLNYYIQYLSLRCDAYEIETMTKGLETIRQRMNDIELKSSSEYSGDGPTNKEKALVDTLEVCEELYARGFEIGMVDLYQSKATEFTIDKNNPKRLIPPFVVIDGLGQNVARSIVSAREESAFISKEDIIKRTQLSASLLKKLDLYGCLEGLQETNQISLF